MMATQMDAPTAMAAKQPNEPSAPGGSVRHRLGGMVWLLAGAGVLLVSGCASRPSVDRPAAVQVVREVPEFYTVRSGDTVSKIALRYGLDYRAVGALNGLDDRYLIHVNQQLRLRKATGSASRTVALATPAPQPRATPLPAPVVSAPAARPPVTLAPTNSALQWQWPVRLPVSQSFDLARKVRGIWFDGAPGTPVQAAASGEVVYASNGLTEYGNLVLIRHTDGYISAYAHLQDMAVKQGDRVAAGQTVGQLGSSGATRPALEFQIRQSGKPVDPQTLLPTR